MTFLHHHIFSIDNYYFLSFVVLVHNQKQVETCEQTKLIICAVNCGEEVATLWLDFQRAVSKEEKLCVEFFQKKSAL